MKILIPYDGSRNADIALDHLQAAELAGREHEILVVVTNVWLPEKIEEVFSTRADRRRRMQLSGISSHAPALRHVEEGRFLAREVRRRLESKYPMFDVRVETLAGDGSVTDEVLERAANWGAELIVLGSLTGELAPGARLAAARANCRVMIAGVARNGAAGGN